MNKFELIRDKNLRKDRVPCWKLNELAAEFGVSVFTLKNLMRHRNGPSPIMKASVSYYDPIAVRKWWRSINDVS